jgi:hypothetical protein
MLGVLLDAAAMFDVIALVTGETPEYLTAVLISLGFSIALAVCFIFLGLAGGLIALLPVVCLFGAILSWVYGASLKRAIAGSFGFLAYKIAIAFAFAAIFR